jgi:hypothetical protein
MMWQQYSLFDMRCERKVREVEREEGRIGDRDEDLIATSKAAAHLACDYTGSGRVA